jgi:hypothetical protein
MTTIVAFSKSIAAGRWLWIEQLTDAPISGAIAKELRSAARL